MADFDNLHGHDGPWVERITSSYFVNMKNLPLPRAACASNPGVNLTVRTYAT